MIVINVGFELGIIPRSVYCMLVMMAILTTFMTTPLLHLFRKGTELDAPMGLAFGPSGDLYVANEGNSTISKITPAGVVGLFAAAAERERLPIHG